MSRLEISGEARSMRWFPKSGFEHGYLYSYKLPMKLNTHSCVENEISLKFEFNDIALEHLLENNRGSNPQSFLLGLPDQSHRSYHR